MADGVARVHFVACAATTNNAIHSRATISSSDALRTRLLCYAMTLIGLHRPLDTTMLQCRSLLDAVLRDFGGGFEDGESKSGVTDLAAVTRREGKREKDYSPREITGYYLGKILSRKFLRRMDGRPGRHE